MNSSRLIIAGLSGDSGKTVGSLALLAALRRRGLRLAAFKKGPDYIDAAWLGFVSARPCRNLDTYLMARNDVRRSFLTHTRDADIAIIEGNRGLFDGKDVVGTHSTAELAKLLDTPVVLVVDVTKTTRTVAAVINGCRAFDPDVNLAGVILNRVAGPRHERIVKDTIEKYCRLPVVGCLPRLKEDPSLIPGRHLGLVPPAEHQTGDNLVARLEELAREHLDLEALVDVASSAAELDVLQVSSPAPVSRRVKIGYFADSAFTFYYPENLEALMSQGAELVPVSSLESADLPEIHGLYIGGGFPETHAGRLAANRSMMASVRERAERGLPVYAECGGLIYLCRSLLWQGETHRMTGFFDIDLTLHRRPMGHGYTEVRVDRPNPFYEPGDRIRGHEFHYSAPVAELDRSVGCLQVATGVGLGNGRDGLTKRNVLACYTHVHAAGVPSWAAAFVRAARSFRAECEEPRNSHASRSGLAQRDADTANASEPSCAVT